MKKLSVLFVIVSALLLLPADAISQETVKPLPEGLSEETLRLDYIFTGTDKEAVISLYRMNRSEGWAGRRVNMETAPLRGNGQIILRDSATRKVLYVNSFSTLFQEWQATEEAVRTRKSFENVFLVPMPLSPATVTVELYDVRNNVCATFTHGLRPDDILIKKTGGKDKWLATGREGEDRDFGEAAPMPYRYMHRGGSPEECIDVAIVAEGYTASEMDVFYRDAMKATEDILAYEPYKSMQGKFNFVAVGVPSRESGVSIPHNNEWLNTALESHFDTFYMDRYLTTLHLFKLHDALAGIPYEHIIILANTENYGGGGIFNSYVLSAAHNKWASPVVVHEFGHSFGGLADEYFYDDMYSPYYLPDVEPWEQNITTLADFSRKWADMLDGARGSEVVAKAEQKSEKWKTDFNDRKTYKVGIYEGGGYQSEGVYRPYPTCRMRDNSYPDFCPVCRRAIERIIDFYTVGHGSEVPARREDAPEKSCKQLQR